MKIATLCFLVLAMFMASLAVTEASLAQILLIKSLLAKQQAGRCGKRCGYYAKCVLDKSDNYHQSYRCECIRGYSGDGFTCKRINPCDTAICSQYAYCLPRGHRAICKCFSGYKGNGKTCERIDPCRNNKCSSYATCQPYGYRYTCTCNEGYRGNGFKCLVVRPVQSYRPTYKKW